MSEIVDSETTCRVHDPNNGEGTTSVVVCFTSIPPYDDVEIYGVFREDDSEIALDSLTNQDKDTAYSACHQHLKKIHP